MDKEIGKLTVFFEEPFWVGIFEHIEDGKLSVAKVTFGAEPNDCEVYEYIQKYYFGLKFSPAVDAVVKDLKINPKRMQREVKKTNDTNRHRNKITASIKIATGAEQAGAQSEKPRAKGGGG